MDYIRISGGVMLIVCGTLAGMYASLKWQTKLRVYEQYLAFLTQAQSLVEYNAVSVKELIAAVRAVPLLRPILDETRDQLDKGIPTEQAWRIAAAAGLAKYGFTRTERQLFYFWGDTFGSSDIDGEIAKLHLHCDLVTQKAEELRRELDAKKKICRITGMFAGTLAAVLLY